MDTNQPALPSHEFVGDTGRWVLSNGAYRRRTWTPLPDVVVEGRFLGFGSSELTLDGEEKRRWVEVRIFVTDDDYVVHVAGMSRVNGERTWSRVDRRTSPDEIIETLVKRKEGEDAYLPMPARRALEQTAVEDPAMREAYAEHRAAYFAA